MAMGTLNNIFSDPTVLKMMAGVGQQMDPQGAGGFLGGPAQDMLGEQARKRSHEAEQKDREKLMEILARGGEGTTITQKPDGSTTIKAGKGGQSDLDKPGLKTPESGQYFENLDEFSQKMLGSLPEGERTQENASALSHMHKQFLMWQELFGSLLGGSK